jgi:hypothetical protein
VGIVDGVQSKIVISVGEREKERGRARGPRARPLVVQYTLTTLLDCC